MISRALMKSSRADWNTPESVLAFVRQVGAIQLDPCSNAASIVAARTAWDGMIVDGLTFSWWNDARDGLAYMNPPYGRHIGGWIDKAAAEARHGVEIVGLVPARTDAKWWQVGIFDTAQAVCFWRGRITFIGAKHPAPFPSAVVYWGARARSFARVFSAAGQVVRL